MQQPAQRRARGAIDVLVARAANAPKLRRDALKGASTLFDHRRLSSLRRMPRLLRLLLPLLLLTSGLLTFFLLGLRSFFHLSLTLCTFKLCGLLGLRL